MFAFRLNLWQRLGVVASVAWVLGAMTYEYVHYRTQYELAREASISGDIETCREQFGLGPTDCYLKGQIHSFEPPEMGVRRQFWYNAILPLLLGWLAVIPLSWIANWVLAGRRDDG